MGVNNLPRVAARQCTGRESNPRPLDHESNALPLHYRVTHLEQCQTGLRQIYVNDALRDGDDIGAKSSKFNVTALAYQGFASRMVLYPAGSRGRNRAGVCGRSPDAEARSDVHTEAAGCSC